MRTDRDFIPLNIAVLTVSDTRTLEQDTSGALLAERVTSSGHRLHDRQIVKDDIYALRAVVSQWIADPDCQVVLLDELTYMLTYGYLDSDRVCQALESRPADQHVIITGRNASDRLTGLADTVSEVRDIKHAFNSGIRVQKGIDY